jgi:hypothetical protein
MQGSSALGMILWSQLLGNLLESAYCLSWKPGGLHAGQQRLESLCPDVYFALNGVYGISFVLDHVTHVQANCTEDLIPSEVPRSLCGQCVSMFLVRVCT